MARRVVVNLERVRRTLAALDALVARFPRLRSPAAQARLEAALGEDGKALDEDGKGGERGDDDDDEGR